MIELILIGSISSFSEIHESDTSSLKRLSSFIFAWIILACFGILLLTNGFIWWKHNSSDEYKMTEMFWEFFDGVKNTKSARLYTFLDIFRKISLCAWLLMFPGFDKNIKVCGFLIIQLFFWIYTFISQPFEMKRDNMREWLNELMITFYAIFFLKYNEQHLWNNAIAWVYYSTFLLYRFTYWYQPLLSSLDEQ